MGRITPGRDRITLHGESHDSSWRVIFFLDKMTFMMILIEISYQIGKQIYIMTSFYFVSIELEVLCSLAKCRVITFHE